MAQTEAASGTLASGGHTVGTTYTSLTTGLTAGIYIVRVNLSNLAAGGVGNVLVLDKTISTGTAIAMMDAPFGGFGGAPAEPLYILPAVAIQHAGEVRIRQTTGTARAYEWSIVKLA